MFTRSLPLFLLIFSATAQPSEGSRPANFLYEEDDKQLVNLIRYPKDVKGKVTRRKAAQVCVKTTVAVGWRTVCGLPAVDELLQRNWVNSLWEGHSTIATLVKSTEIAVSSGDTGASGL